MATLLSIGSFNAEQPVWEVIEWPRRVDRHRQRVTPVERGAHVQVLGAEPVTYTVSLRYLPLQRGTTDFWMIGRAGRGDGYVDLVDMVGQAGVLLLGGVNFGEFAVTSKEDTSERELGGVPVMLRVDLVLTGVNPRPLRTIAEAQS